MKITTSHAYFPVQPLMSAVTTQAIAPSIGSWFTAVGQTLKTWLVVDKEPKVTQVMGRNGQSWWRVYNPDTNQYLWMTSEAEVMVWLDTRRH